MYDLKQLKDKLSKNIKKQDELIKYICQNIVAVKEKAEKLIIIVEVKPEYQSDIIKKEADITKILSDILDMPVSLVFTAEHNSETSNSKDTGKIKLPNIKNIIAIASGKGGVGKSTITRNLAEALKSQGLKIGILDADILGASQPTMFGFDGMAKINSKKQIEPVKISGIKTMSIAYMLEDTKSAIIWRGPMLQRALLQMFQLVNWGDLDILLIDMPPGTGDVSLTVAQYVEIKGAIIISTPQDVALLDSIKSLEMFQKLNINIMGMIENMSMFTCPNCGHETDIFGHGGVKLEAHKLGVEFLGEVPLLLDIRKSADIGKIKQDIINKHFVPIAKNMRSVLGR